MVFVYDNSHRWLLRKTKLTAGLIPEPVTVGRHPGSLDTVHHDTAAGFQVAQHLGHDFLEVTTVTADEDGIGCPVCCDVIATSRKEVADMHTDAWGAEATGILADDGLTLRPHLEGFNVQMRKLQAGLYRDAARAEADVPEYFSPGQLQCLQRQQADGHLGNHLLATVK